MTRALLAFLLCPSVAAAIELSWQPETPRPGDPVLVSLAGIAPDIAPAPEGELGTRTLRFWFASGGWHAITSLSVELEDASLPLVVRVGGRAVERTVRVEPATFRERELTVAKKFVEPTKSERRRSAEDQRAFSAAMSGDWTPPLVGHAFIVPRDDDITAPFGDKRMLNGRKQSQHYGVDYDGRIGSPIVATNDGRVVMVRDCFSSGRTIVIDHGAGIYSMYFHLSKFRVKQGQSVRSGQRLGDVGKTGRVTGPHLHFSVKIDGWYVDPERLYTIGWPRLAPAPPATASTPPP